MMEWIPSFFTSATQARTAASGTGEAISPAYPGRDYRASLASNTHIGSVSRNRGRTVDADMGVGSQARTVISTWVRRRDSFTQARTAASGTGEAISPGYAGEIASPAPE